MGKKCPKCKSTNTTSDAPGEMRCRDCAHSWFTRNIAPEKPIKEEPRFNIFTGDFK